MNHTHLVTGATGFVGSAVVAELLEKTHDKIICLVRKKKGQSVQERMFQTLHNIVALYNLPKELHKKIDTRCIAVEGDLTEKITNIDTLVHENISHVWHCAASLDYEERFAEQIHKINVDGTKKALNLAQELNASYFNHVSTAYVAGSNQGEIEEKITEIEAPNNTYEESKILGEKLALNTTNTKLKTRVFRPSIVVGHSKTLGVLSFSGLYGFARRLVQFNGIMNRVKKDFLNTHRIKMIVEKDIPINFVPVDMVAQEMVEIGLSETDSQFFHLSNPNVLTAREAVDAVFETAGVTPPEYVETEDEFSEVDKKFNDKVEFYSSYLRGFKKFSRTNCIQILGEKDLQHFAINKEQLLKYVQWYIDSLQEERANKIPAMR